MKKLLSISFLLLFVQCFAAKADSKIKFTPVEHASFIIQYDETTIFVDPVGDENSYSAFGKPDLILITHTHGDHFNADLLGKLKGDKTILVGPKAVTEKLGWGVTMVNGESKTVASLPVEAIAAYNKTEGRLNFHPKGVGNGYVVTLGNERVYISGDTEDIPEMRALKNIDYAFICMNLPYTMTPEQAASAVIKFQPKTVYPYHYRQRDGMADIEKFKKLVNDGCSSKVVFLDWYPKAQ